MQSMLRRLAKLLVTSCRGGSAANDVDAVLERATGLDVANDASKALRERSKSGVSKTDRSSKGLFTACAIVASSSHEHEERSDETSSSATEVFASPQPCQALAAPLRRCSPAGKVSGNGSLQLNRVSRLSRESKNEAPAEGTAAAAAGATESAEVAKPPAAESLATVCSAVLTAEDVIREANEAARAVTASSASGLRNLNHHLAFSSVPTCRSAGSNRSSCREHGSGSGGSHGQMEACSGDIHGWTWEGSDLSCGCPSSVLDSPLLEDIECAANKAAAAVHPKSSLSSSHASSQSNGAGGIYNRMLLAHRAARQRHVRKSSGNSQSVRPSEGKGSPIIASATLNLGGGAVPQLRKQPTAMMTKSHQQVLLGPTVTRSEEVAKAALLGALQHPRCESLPKVTTAVAFAAHQDALGCPFFQSDVSFVGDASAIVPSSQRHPSKVPMPLRKGLTRNTCAEPCFMITEQGTAAPENGAYFVGCNGSVSPPEDSTDANSTKSAAAATGNAVSGPVQPPTKSKAMFRRSSAVQLSGNIVKGNLLHKTISVSSLTLRLPSCQEQPGCTVSPKAARFGCPPLTVGSLAWDRSVEEREECEEERKATLAFLHELSMHSNSFSRWARFTSCLVGFKSTTEFFHFLQQEAERRRRGSSLRGAHTRRSPTQQHALADSLFLCRGRVPSPLPPANFTARLVRQRAVRWSPAVNPRLGRQHGHCCCCCCSCRRGQQATQQQIDGAGQSAGSNTVNV